MRLCLWGWVAGLEGGGGWLGLILWDEGWAGVGVGARVLPETRSWRDVWPPADNSKKMPFVGFFVWTLCTLSTGGRGEGQGEGGERGRRVRPSSAGEGRVSPFPPAHTRGPRGRP